MMEIKKMAFESKEIDPGPISYDQVKSQKRRTTAVFILIFLIPILWVAFESNRQAGF